MVECNTQRNVTFLVIFTTNPTSLTLIMAPAGHLALAPACNLAAKLDARNTVLFFRLIDSAPYTYTHLLQMSDNLCNSYLTAN